MSNRTPQHNRGAGDMADRKKPYQTPSLKRFGKVRDLTQGRGSAGGDGGSTRGFGLGVG